MIDYNYLREQTRFEAERVKKDLDDTLSYCSRAYSDISSVSQFGQEKPNKWEGIIKSGTSIDNLKFFD